MILPIVLFIFVLIVCACALTLLAFDALEGEKIFRLEQQSNLQNKFLKMEDGKIQEKFENKRKKTKQIDITKYLLKSRLKPDKKCPSVNEYIPKTKVPTCKTCPDMDDYVRKTEIPSCPSPPDMSNYIHKNDIPKPFWHHLTGIANMFKKHFMKYYPKPIKVEHPPQEESKPSEPESKPAPEPEPDSYGNDTTHMSLFASDDILRPANSFTCNGYAPQRTDTCYYY
jgi:hypothetical protein